MSETMYTSPLNAPLSRGERPEQTFFKDKALDRIFGVVMGLAAEVSVLQDKMIILEVILKEKNIEIDWDIAREKMDTNGLLKKNRAEYVKNLLDPILGIQRSQGAA